MAEKKEKWRKKRSILEAKRRRLGYFNDNDLDDEEKDGLPEVEKAESAESDSNAPPTATTRKPRLFIDGTLGGGGHSQAILEQLSPGDILIGCDVDPDALATAAHRLNQYLGTSEYILDSEQCGR